MPSDALDAVPAPADPAIAPDEMSIIEHLEELRWRIFKSLGAVAAAAIAVFGFNAPVVRLLELPIKPNGLPIHVTTAQPIELIFTSPGEYFVAVVKVALLGGVYLALPVILYQLLAFVGPGLTPRERRWTYPIVAAAFALFSLGIVFAYLLLLPPAINFLVGFAPADVRAMLAIGKYLGFVAGLIFATGLAFQLPLFLLGASAMGVVTSYVLRRYRKHAFIAALLLAGVLSPSVDLLSQGLLASALYVLFELSIVLIALTGK